MSISYLPQSTKDTPDSTDHTVEEVARKYKQIKSQRFYRYTYYKGIQFSRQLRTFKRQGKRLFLKILDNLSKAKQVSLTTIKQAVISKSNEVIQLFYKSYIDLQVKKKDILKEKSSKSILAKLDILGSTIYSVLRPISTILLKLFNYVAPVAAVAMFVFTIQFFMGLNFGLQVDLYGESLGYIKNEQVFEQADKLMQGRINYSETEDILYSTPTYKVVLVGEDEFIESNTLCDNIILSSGSSVTQATGLYIDNVFHGATTEGELVQDTLTQVLYNNKLGIEDEHVEFAQDIKLVDGLYLPSSMIEDTQTVLNNVTGESQVTGTYVLQEGDTPSLVAQKMGMTVDSLSMLNPSLGESFPQGEEIVIGETKPYLTVISKGKVTYDENLPYESVTEEDDTKDKGFSEVVQEGEEGLVKKTAEVSYINGVEVEKVVIIEQVMKEAVPEKTVLGTKEPVKKSTKTTTAQKSSDSGTSTVAASSGGSTGSGQFSWPVASGGNITCGWLGYSGHRALDIQSFSGDSIIAADSGTVVSVVYGSTGYGYHVVVDHGNGYRTLYAHMSDIYVSKGQSVSRGQSLGAQGRTGNATGVHLHFEIIKNGTQVNPRNYL